MEVIGWVFALIIVLGIYVTPGIIATRREHAYKGVIWAISLVGAFFYGLGWIVGLVWALWPADKTLVDPIVGNTTGIGSRNTGHVFGENEKSKFESSKSDVRSKLAELDEMLHSGLVTKKEYDQLRQKVLGLS